MKLSILDQSPIVVGETAQQALYSSKELAQAGEELGYTRYWIAEHHDMPGLASSAPEIMLGYIGARTKHIKIGSGAVLLPHYKPYKIAETFNMLATLFPNRIDIGIGRAPGGSAEASIALSGNFLENVRKIPESVSELLHFIHNDFPEDNFFANTKASPLPCEPPMTWILGTSEKSAELAAENGTGYVFGHFMSDDDNLNITNKYQRKFKSNRNQKPYIIITVSVICAETNELAEELALYHDYWRLHSLKGEQVNQLPPYQELKKYKYTDEDKEMLKMMRQKRIVGNPKEVHHQLMEIKNNYQADEIMIVTITHNNQYRINSYKLIANQILAKS